jgi:WD40 repeat protein
LGQTVGVADKGSVRAMEIDRIRVTAAAATVIGTALFVGLMSSTGTSSVTGCGPQASSDGSQLFPQIKFARLLSAPNEHYPAFNMVSGTSNLTWSPDGERLAAYVRNGLAITVWSPDGKVQHEIPRYNKAGLTSAYVLGFLSGHDQLLTGPAASDPNDLLAVEDVAFSIVDAETGQVVHNVIGLNPGKSFRENIVTAAAISPDGRFVAVIYNVIYDLSADRRVGIYSTDNWQRIAAIPLSYESDSPRADAISFSPSGKMLAVTYQNKFGDNKRIDIFNVPAWTLNRSIETFPELPRTVHTSTAAVRFSSDETMIAVILNGGGAYWKYPNGGLAPKGVGNVFVTPIPEPLRVFKISDGMRLASAGEFAGGFEENKMSWSPIGNFIEFLDLRGYLYFWDPLSTGGPHEMCQLVRTTTAASFSPNGKMLSQGFDEGVNLYDLTGEH